MKVILTQAVPGLGDAGTIKEVADGYARNYLLPRNMAVAATRTTVKQAEAQANVYARRANKAQEQVKGLAASIEGKTVLIRARVGSENRLYGSVTPNDLADALASQHGVQVDRRKIELAEVIHRTGTYAATADLGSGVVANFNVEVAPEAAGAHGKANVISDQAVVTSSADTAPGEGGDTVSDADSGETEPQAEEEVETNPS